MADKVRTVKKIKKRRPKRQPVVAGWREWVALPVFGVASLKVKLDTGARTSALHAWDIHPFERDGVLWVRFTLHPLQRNNSVRIPCEAPLVGKRAVRSTSGKSETRFVIRTTVLLGGQERKIEVTLTNRDQMGFRMLLGRTAMRRWIVVDPARSFLHGSRIDIANGPSADTLLKIGEPQ
ncbi:MAG: ATP-dependent zinc protease [Rhodospirillales bacterium]|nr:ATP-dependent zinc protease [Rhodospirillales bacterium]